MPRSQSHARPHVLAIGGLDPAGCAGLHADVLTINQLGGHASSVATTLTVQTESSASQSQAVANGLIHAQLRALLQTSSQAPAAIKVGLIKDGRHWAAIRRYRKQQALVIDPVIQSSSGLHLAALDSRWKKGFKRISAEASLLTPNQSEWALLKPLVHPQASVLVTGDQANGQIINRLYLASELTQEFTTPAIAGEFRGTGCRLASAITFYLASGQPLTTAIEAAMQHLAEQIAQAYPHGQATIPATLHQGR